MQIETKDQMNPYTRFAEVYDYMLQHIDYQRWFEYIRDTMIQFTPEPQKLLEIGCGTGKFCTKFVREGYDIIGLDNSIEMLSIAKIQTLGKFPTICSDMRNFTFNQKFDFIYCIHDAMNYNITTTDFTASLKSAYDNLKTGGIYMFDVTTEFNIEENFDSALSIYNTRDIEITWSNTYEKDKKLIHSYLNFTDKDGNEKQEIHIQKIYSIDKVVKMAKSVGFKVLDIFGDLTYNSPEEESVMINFIMEK